MNLYTLRAEGEDLIVRASNIREAVDVYLSQDSAYDEGDIEGIALVCVEINILEMR